MVKKNKCLDCEKACSGKRCKECYIKFSGTAFDFGEWHFDTKKKLDFTIKILLSESPRNIEFENEFFKSLINKYHEGVRKHKLEVTKFKILDFQNQIGIWEFARERYRGGLLVLGFFEPIKKWHGVTLYPHKKTNERQKLILVLRQKWAEYVGLKDRPTRCEGCGNINKVELHHDSISFKEIANKCMGYFSEDEIKYGPGDNWWEHESESDAVPDSHPAVKRMIELHDGIKYKWLCVNCHNEKKE